MNHGRKLLLCAGSILGCSGAIVVCSSPYLKINATCKETFWDYNWDFRDAASLVKPNSSIEAIEAKRSSARRKLYLIRHGQYEQDHKPSIDDKNNANSKTKREDSDKYRILTPLGRSQAECTGKHLASLGVKYSDFIVSTMTRANETGGIIFQQLEKFQPDFLEEDIDVEKTDLLREGHPITPVPYNRFKPDSWEFTDGCRIEAAFRKYFYRAHYDQKEESHEIIVCHANVIRYFVCRALQNAPEAWLRMSLANGSITEVILEPNGEVYVTGIGDKGHIPADMVSFS